MASTLRNRQTTKLDEEETAQFLQTDEATIRRKSPEEFAQKQSELIRKYELKRKQERQQRLEKWVGRMNWLSDKVQVLAWVIGAGYLMYYINFFGVFWDNEDVDRFWLTIALASMGLNIVLIFYLSFILPYVFKVEEEWEVYCPRVIPAATAIGVLFMFTGILAFWPVWGWFTIPIVFIVFMGFINALQLLPGGMLGSLLFFVGFVLLILYSHYLKL
mmetsp:Transcript_43601/g.50160  ORF Transcript_43601/g.50160 Transcript_43601/m.50160 type:complete len:217 (+) Transcript_43601:92-742(+)